MPFSPPNGINFRTNDEIPIANLCMALRRVVFFLQGLRLSPQHLRLYHDWWEHDGLHFYQRVFSFHEFFSLIETPRALFEATPDDHKVFVGVAPQDVSWYLRVRAEWDAADQFIVGSFALTLPQATAALFRSEVVASLELPLIEEEAEQYYHRVMFT